MAPSLGSTINVIPPVSSVTNYKIAYYLKGKKTILFSASYF